MSDCIFCKIAAGEIPSEAVYSNDKVHVFKDLDPKAPVHYLVIPKQHIASAAEVDSTNDGAVAACFLAIAELAKTAELRDGFRVVSNCGEKAGQSVLHLHFHVLAGRALAWPPG